MERSNRGICRATIAVVAALALGLVACGDEDSSDDTTAAEGASTATVDVTAVEYEFDLSATPTADTETVTFTNDGKEFHALVFARLNEGFTVDEAYKLQGKEGSAEEIGTVEAKPGDTGTIKVKEPLAAGDYVMLCPISGPDGPHYKLGQLAEFAIE
jgi:plastocyanin